MKNNTNVIQNMATDSRLKIMKEHTMKRRLWAYRNNFGWFAVDPEECDFDEGKVDGVEAILEAETKHELMQMAEAANFEIAMWLE